MYRDIKDIYDSLLDEESKMIFRYRLFYSLTGERKYIREWLREYSEEDKGYYDVFDVYKHPEMIKNRTVILFGTGLWSNLIKKVLYFCESTFDFYCDNNTNKVGTELLGKRIISVAELVDKHKDAIVFIATKDFQDEILLQLEQLGFDKEQIIRIPKYETMYTDKSLFLPNGKEIFVDCGCFDGLNAIEFSKWCNGNGKVYAFEPDQKNVEICKMKLNKECMVPYELIEKGTWSDETILCFSNDGTSSSHIGNEGEKVMVTSIDKTIKESDKITFIKMDIEGAELEALKGAMNIIKRDKPRLAISVYHKPEDILEIPKFIKSIIPEYKFYLRSYVPFNNETVLYAVCDVK